MIVKKTPQCGTVTKMVIAYDAVNVYVARGGVRLELNIYICYIQQDFVR